MQRGKASKANVSEDACQGAGKSARYMKSGQIVKAAGKETGILVNMPEPSYYAPEKITLRLRSQGAGCNALRLSGYS
jgi:hypothetical protein